MKFSSVSSTLAGGVAIIVCYYLGTLLQPRLPISLPSALIGLLIMFAWLTLLQRVPAGVEKASLPILKHMSIFFVPATLAAVNYADVLTEHAMVLFIALVLTTLVSIGLTALLAKWLLTGGKGE
ncbi:CidA/LrgA family protein [Aestuariibacter salexigens]|uniref:CidA/LrgA family protein n=1 Tax=Aestuariibacter salexigens TaxID=226010 RepID=UPI00041BFFB6|nr:CidA/LrgA family protein [Aestuariibacter salexigens]